MTDRDGAITTDSASSSAANPLSRKLNKILETRLDNDKVWNNYLRFVVQ